MPIDRNNSPACRLNWSRILPTTGTSLASRDGMSWSSAADRAPSSSPRCSTKLVPRCRSYHGGPSNGWRPIGRARAAPWRRSWPRTRASHLAGTTGYGTIGQSCFIDSRSRGRTPITRSTLRGRRTVTRLEVAHGRLKATISDGPTVSADHIILATGYTVDINRLTMIHPALRATIATDRASPVLSHWFESSVPGLYFVGLTSLRAFGPLYRFVAGCGAAARRVADGVMRGRGRRSRAVPKPNRDGAATLRSETPAGQV